MSMTKANRDSDKFMLRMPDGLRDRIKTASEHSGRSMNSEIVSALEGVYPEPADVLTLARQSMAHIEEVLADVAAHDSAGDGRRSELEAAAKALHARLSEFNAAFGKE
jgi:predicted DNA-binding protein